MAPKAIRVESVPRAKAPSYLKKAQEFYGLMLEASRRGEWNGVGLNGIHCAISATDALLVSYAGVRSRSESHMDVVALLQQKIPRKDLGDQPQRLARILREKSAVEYGAEEFRMTEATNLERQVDRYFTWVRQMLLEG